MSPLIVVSYIKERSFKMSKSKCVFGIVFICGMENVVCVLCASVYV